jgi:hypothetical protein
VSRAVIVVIGALLVLCWVAMAALLYAAGGDP